MEFEVIPVNLNEPKDKGLLLFFEYSNRSEEFGIKSFEEFRDFKNEEGSLELRWDFVIIKQKSPIGVLSLKNMFIEPSPLYFFEIDLDDEFLVLS